MELQSGRLKNQTAALSRIIIIQLFTMSPRKETFEKVDTLFFSYLR